MKSPKVTPRPHTAGIVAALITTLGLILEALTDSQVLQLLPHWASIAITIGGIVLQALTKGVTQGNTVLITRDEAIGVGFAKPKERKPKTPKPERVP